MANKRFRRTPEELDLGLTVEQAKEYRKTGELPKEVTEQVEQYEKDTTDGLGDKVEKVFKAVGVKQIIDYLNGGEECEGCKKRKEALNKFRTRKKPLTLTAEEFIWLRDFFREKRNTVKKTELDMLYRIHARVWRYKFSPAGNCGSCTVQKVNDLRDLYEQIYK
jgi:hypothetical protein